MCLVRFKLTTSAMLRHILECCLYQLAQLAIDCHKQASATPVAGIGPVCAVTLANATGCHSKLLQQPITSSVGYTTDIHLSLLRRATSGGFNWVLCTVTAQTAAVTHSELSGCGFIKEQHPNDHGATDACSCQGSWVLLV
jgi:hypothetical protein